MQALIQTAQLGLVVLGGVLVDHRGAQVAAFSCKLDYELLKVLGFPAKSTVIFEAELLALLLGMSLWKKKLRGRPCVCYVDNNATKGRIHCRKSPHTTRPEPRHGFA